MSSRSWLVLAFVFVAGWLVGHSGSSPKTIPRGGYPW